MLSMKMYAESDSEGNVRLELPVGMHNTNYEVVVVLQPINVATAQKEQMTTEGHKTPEELGYPPGFFDLAGALADDPIPEVVRGIDDSQKRDELEWSAGFVEQTADPLKLERPVQ